MQGKSLRPFDGDIIGVSACGLQGQIYRQSRAARPLPGGRLLR